MGHASSSAAATTGEPATGINHYTAQRRQIKAEAAGLLLRVARELGGGKTALVFMNCPGLDTDRFVERFCGRTGLARQQPLQENGTSRATYVPQWPTSNTDRCQEAVATCTAMLASTVQQHLPSGKLPVGSGRVPRVFSMSALELTATHVPTALAMCNSAALVDSSRWALSELGAAALSTMKVDIDVTRTLFVYLRLDDRAAWAQMCSQCGVPTDVSSFHSRCRALMDQTFYQVGATDTAVIHAYHTCVVHVHTSTLLGDDFIWEVAHILAKRVLALNEQNHWGSASHAAVLATLEYKQQRCQDMLSFEPDTDPAPAASVHV
jgi:hypothetical protein